MRTLQRAFALSAMMISVTKSAQSLERRLAERSPSPSVFNGPTVGQTPGIGIADTANSSDMPTLTPTSAPLQPVTTSPANNNSTANSTAPSITPTLAPVMMNNKRPVPPLLSDSPVQSPVSPTDSPSEAPDNTIHDKEPVSRPKTPNGSSPNEDKSTNNNNNGLSNGAIFGMVIAIGAILVVGYFVFFGGRNTSKRSTRRDGMREMEMSTWVNNNDNDGLL